MYIMCPNKWSTVYHLAEPMRKFPGHYRSWCQQGGYLVGTQLVRYGTDIRGRYSQTFAPIAVEGIPIGRRLCKECERLRLTRGSSGRAELPDFERSGESGPPLNPDR